VKGTIRINNVLHDEIPPNGCHSSRAPHRFVSPVVRHGSGGPYSPSWPHVMSTDCKYDRRSIDDRCAGCTHP
jgi:hypothetical protein